MGRTTRPPLRRPSPFVDAGWAATRHNYRAAWRGPAGFVAMRVPGEGWVLLRDCHESSAYFATYKTAADLLKDVRFALRMDRKRNDAPQGPPVPVCGVWDCAESDRWADDDPRWDLDRRTLGFRDDRCSVCGNASMAANERGFELCGKHLRMCSDDAVVRLGLLPIEASVR